MSLLEEVLNEANIERAIKAVMANKGAPGVDGMKTGQLPELFATHGNEIREAIRNRTYEPTPVRRREIPKPSGGVRKLGIPTARDRVIQQAIAQTMSPKADIFFSESSYGFRPNRSAQMAIVRCLELFNDGYEWIVDIDLAKFFDNVPHDRLMSKVHLVVDDGTIESLIRKFLKAGCVTSEGFEETEVGTPQGGPLSPLLSNIYLDELDKELEARGLRFCRYADDVVILVKSHIAARRVMKSVVSFIERRMKLKVNAEKTKIVPPNGLTYLGYSFYKDKERWRARVSEEKFSSLKSKVRMLTQRNDPTTTQEMCNRLTRLFRGWINYFRLADMKGHMEKLWQWVKGRIRVIIYKRWKKPKKREEALLRCWEIRKKMENMQGWKISEGRMRSNARGIANQGNHYAKIAKSATFAHFVSDFLLEKKGLLNPLKYYLERRKSLC
ncbi:MAG: group II intron reverse transcriptase/maturase [Lachnospiraceae bacterium]|nr:group II intron reverse transcriptase/maturase [Lachnospiraceae bacterium]